MNIIIISEGEKRSVELSNGKIKIRHRWPVRGTIDYEARAEGYLGIGIGDTPLQAILDLESKQEKSSTH